jgi:monovalent cation/hydrogen antiporter
VLVGLELQSAVRGLSSVALARGVVAVAAVTVVIIGVRFAWIFSTTYLIRLVDRRPQQRLRRVSNRARVVSAVAGFRGAVSLAAALAVPKTVASGEPFPGRDVIIFVTTGVIVVTLVLQGLLLPGVVLWARLPRDTAVEEERRLAETRATQEALAALPQLAVNLGTDPLVVDRLRLEYEEHLHVLHTNGEDAYDEPARRHDQQYTALRLALLTLKRGTVVRLRDERRIDDIVLRQIQARLDIEEVRLTRGQAIE